MKQKCSRRRTEENKVAETEVEVNRDHSIKIEKGGVTLVEDVLEGCSALSNIIGTRRTTLQQRNTKTTEKQKKK